VKRFWYPRVLAEEMSPVCRFMAVVTSSTTTRDPQAGHGSSGLAEVPVATDIPAVAVVRHLRNGTDWRRDQPPGLAGSTDRCEADRERVNPTLVQHKTS
jgi:hypothetical protein